MQHAHTNQLIDETSPYLLQHAHNPVDWYPWNEEALQKAKDENKMLIISIGYSSCHWCHVMEHESFEDTAVAAIMNRHFINIKVDREERPDVDDVYMTACQLSSNGNCGWPLNAFALPDGRPVWAGTYFPKKRWIEILDYFIQSYANEKEKLEEYAGGLAAGISHLGLDTLNQATQEISFSEKQAEEVTKTFLSRMDPKHGGRRGAPKFPMPNNWEYLMHYAHAYEHEEAADQVMVTLTRMMEGGIYDQLEGGFARYSTDDQWLVPHFEKMLYDNGQLVSLYANAYAWSGNIEFKKVVTQTLAFVHQYWSDPAGGFYSSFDADSEGEEGKYYVWTFEELNTFIPDESDRKIFFDYYNISKGGNWEGVNILHRKQDITDLARAHKLTEEEIIQRIASVEKVLIDARKKRVSPGLDDKVLASWNGLMLKGYVDAYRATGETQYLERSIANATFIRDKLIKENGRIERNYKNGQSTINGFLDDYANVIQAFLALYQATFDEQWLKIADTMTSHVLTHFTSPDNAFFYFTSDLDPPLIARRMEISDNVIPSANSTMARNLLVLGEILYQPEYTERSKSMLLQVWPMILRDGQPSFYSNWCQLLLDHIRTPFEVAIVGQDFQDKLSAMQRHYLPGTVFIGGIDEGSLPLLKDKLSPGQTMIYVCQNKICKLPTEDTQKALSLMER